MSDNEREQQQNTWADRNEKPKQWAERMSDSEQMEARRRKLTPQILEVMGAHIIASFLALLSTYLLGLVVGDSAAFVIGYAAGIFAFVAVLYSAGWRAGDQDINLMNYGHIKRDKLRGLKAACIAESLGLLFAILAVWHFSVVANNLAAGMDKTLAEQGVFWWFGSIYHIYYYPFTCFIYPLEFVSPFFCLLPVIFAPVIYHIAYTLGMKRISLGEKLMYKKQDDKK